MGIFDIFTGDPAKEAAAKNAALLQANKTEGTNTLQTGQTNALGSLGAAGDIYAGLGNKYGGGTDMYLNSLGLNGPAGNAAATNAFQAGPGYRYAVDQSLDGISRSAAARGGDVGGNTLAALGDRAGNMADQQYGQWQSNLAGLINPEIAGVSGAAGAKAAEAPVYTGTASNIAGLGTSTANGIANQNTQSANAEMAGSGNLWGLGLNLAKLGVGAATGGTSLLGGGLGGGGGLSSGMAFNNPAANNPYYGPLN